MIGQTGRAMLTAGVVLASAGEASSHEMPWPRGMSRQITAGACAQGECRVRSSFSASVPHDHVAPGTCVGKGAAGYTARRRFDCPPRR